MPPQNQRRFVGIQTLELPGFAQPQTHRSLEPRACLYECPYLASASLAGAMAQTRITLMRQ